MKQSLTFTLVGLALASAQPHGQNATFQLVERQTDSDVITPLVTCEGFVPKVTACNPEVDLTPANWINFDIDGYLIDFIQQFGTRDDFPNYFVQNQIPPISSGFFFDCTNFIDAPCFHPLVRNPATTTDCALSAIPQVDSFVCGRYIAPQAGFIVQNWINLFNGLKDQFNAIEDAANAILNSDFIDAIVDGLSPEKESVLAAVGDMFKDLALAILPIGGEIKAAGTFVKKLGVIFEAGGEDIISNSIGIVQVVQANADIEDNAAAAKDLLKRQVQAVVSDTQNFYLDLLTKIFVGPTTDPAFIGENDSAAIATNAFKFAKNGEFLEPLPSRQDLAKQMQNNLQHWIISTIMKKMAYDLIVDDTPLLDPPDQPGASCAGNKGIPLSGHPCALFRVDGITFDRKENAGAKAANDPSVVRKVDFNAAFQNALDCNGALPDFKGFLQPQDNSVLPTCFYSFDILFRDV